MTRDDFDYALENTRVILARAECDYRAPAHFGDAANAGPITRGASAKAWSGMSRWSPASC